MGGKFNICFLILCAYLSQEIEGLPKENIEDSSNLQVHQEGTINSFRDTSKRIKIEDSPYIVNIYQNQRRVCSGSILSSTVVITVAACISGNDRQKDFILSGTSNILKGKRHGIERKIKQGTGSNILETSILILLEINPPIDLVQSPNRAIPLHPITDIKGNTLAKYTGWQCVDAHDTAIDLFSKNVPLIDHPTCLQFLSAEALHKFSNTSICTYSSNGDEDICLGDMGGPLVVKEHLIAVMSDISLDDVRQKNIYECINLAERENYEWVMTNLRKLQESATTTKK